MIKCNGGWGRGGRGRSGWGCDWVGIARRLYFHPTRKEASNKEKKQNEVTSFQQGSKHRTRKQAPDKETSTGQGNK